MTKRSHPGRIAGGPKDRWICLYLALALTTALIVVGAGSASASSEEAPPTGLGLAPSLIREATESPGTEKFEAPPTDAQAARQLPHDGLDRGQALDLLSSVFGAEIEAPAAIFDNLEVEKFISNNAAVMPAGSLAAAVSSGEGELTPEGASVPVLVESSVPLRTEDSDGKQAPVDLGLERTEGELRPANPLAETSIPLELDQGIALANEQIRLKFPEAAGERDASSIEGAVAFYPNVEPDTDLAVAPAAEGVETFSQLRTPEAPRTQVVQVELPEGAQLKEAPEGGAEAVQGARTLLSVPPPTAIDAEGNSVATTLSVSGDSVEITVSPTPATAYPILVDPLWRYESYNWTWENSAFSGWEAASTPPSYTALPYMWGTGYKALDMTSGYNAPAAQYAAANWYFHVPRWNSDWATYHERPKSFVFYVALNSMMFLTEGNHAVSPVEVAGVLDETSGTWRSYAQHSGYDGDITGWSGQLGLPNENAQHQIDTNAQAAVVALTATENEAVAKYRTAVVGTAWVGISDRNLPRFTKLSGPQQWLNTETSQVEYQVIDEGLGVYELRLTPPGEAGTTSYPIGCTGLPASPCQREYESGKSGAVTLPIKPATAPQGIDHYKVLATDPLGTLSSPGQGETPGGEADPGTPHWIQEEILVKVDHTAPTLSLSGSLTEQASLGTARPEYTLKYAAADGGEEAPVFQSAFGASGAGAGQLSHPADVTVDPNGNIWVADENNNRIEKFGFKGEFLASYGSLGSGNGQLNHPTGIEADSAGNIWVADTGNNRIEKFSEAGAYLSAFGSSGTGNGKLSSPQGIAVDSAGRVWVADTANNRIEEFNAKGAFLAAFGAKGSTAGQLSEPAALDVAPGGNIWVADTANNRIEVFNEQGDYVGAYGSLGTGNGQFNRPAGIEVDKLGNVWVADLNNSRVEQFSERGEYLGKFGAKGTGSGQFTFSGPIGLTTNRNGRLWVTDSANNRIENWNAPQGNQSGVRSVAIKVDGNIVDQPKLSCETGGCPLAGEWALHSGEYAAGTHTVQVVATDGVSLTATKPLTITLNPPAPSVSLSGTMTEQGTLGKTLPRYNLKLSAAAEEGTGAPPTSAPTYVSSFGSAGAGNGQFSHPGDIAVDGTGNLWVVDENNNRIEKFNAAGAYLTKFGSSGTGNGQLSRPTALAIDSKGNVWVTDAANKRVQEFNEKGEYLTKFGSSGTGNGQFSGAGPEGIAIDSKGNIWVSDTSASRLQEFNSSGTFLKVVGTKGGEPGQLSEPTGIDISPANNVFVADWANSRVEVYNEAGEYIRQFGTQGTGAGQFQQADGIAIDPSGIVWVGDQNNKRVQEFNQNGHFIAQFGSPGSGAGQFNLGYPIGIAADTQGNLWVTDTANNRVQRWREPSRSLVKTEVTVDGKNVDSGEVACTTETCTTAREWVLESSAYSAGSHTVIAKATDGFGKATSKAVTIGIQRDTTKPALATGGELANAPSGWVQQDSYGFTAAATDAGGYGVTSLGFKIDGATVASTSQACPGGSCEAALSKSVSMAAYSGGAHEAEVIASDGAGNVSTKRWTINVDPEGHISTAEATATLEAVEETAPVNVVGESREEEIEGTALGLGIKLDEGELVGTGTAVPIAIEPTPGGGFTVEVPEASAFDDCPHTGPEGEVPPEGSEEEEQAEDAGAACSETAEEETTENGMVPIQVTPIDTKGGATVPYLVEDTSVLSGNTSEGVDSAIRPLTDGGMVWNAIRDGSAPEQYSWRVELGNNQELHLVDEHHAEVYYNDSTPALSITAQPAHDAVGSTVPTSLSVSGEDIVTVTVHHKAGHEGQPFVYPIIEGYGWEGGLTTTIVDFYNRPQEEEEGSEETTEGNFVNVSIWTYGPPETDSDQAAVPWVAELQPANVDPIRKRFAFTTCGHKNINKTESEIPGTGGPGPTEESLKYYQDCHNPELGGVWWGVTVHGTYHYKYHHWVWVYPTQLDCRKRWGIEQPAMVACAREFAETPSGPGQAVHGPVTLRGEYRWPPGHGHFEFNEVACMAVVGEVFPKGGPPIGEQPMRNPMHREYFFTRREVKCPHGE
ncbi:MAG TPA: 6-bladed beta-propeller [Solirubrobacterales bacterium]|nr:6-bladed beta-propeller [Solirubrobacterales bacterium]